MKTTVLNLIGGPGIGKSTLAAKIYTVLKENNISCELVREFVKDWAWEERKVKPLDQLYLLGQQAYRESLLYGKVEYIITDSPILMNGFYSEYYLSQSYLTDAALAFMEHSCSLFTGQDRLNYKHIVLERTKPYDTNGRFECEDKAKEIDWAMEGFLIKHIQPYGSQYMLQKIFPELDLI